MTIEFALVAPALFAIMFGLLDVGRFIATRTMLTQAAAIGARTSCLGAVTTTTTTVDQAVRDAAPGASSISVDWATSTCVGTCGWPRSPGDLVNIRVQYNFTAVFFTTFRKLMTNDARMTC